MKCEKKKVNGEQCKNSAIHNDSFCYWHSKKVSEVDKFNIRSAGGKNKIIRTDGNFPQYKLTSMKDVLKLNALMVNKVLSNELDLRVSTGIAYLLNLQIKCLELHSIEKRLEKIEDKTSADIVIKLPEEFENYNYN